MKTTTKHFFDTEEEFRKGLEEKTIMKKSMIDTYCSHETAHFKTAQELGHYNTQYGFVLDKIEHDMSGDRNILLDLGIILFYLKNGPLSRVKKILLERYANKEDHMYFRYDQVIAFIKYPEDTSPKDIIKITSAPEKLSKGDVTVIIKNYIRSLFKK